ncbi:hypothetical protein IQ05_00342 [Flavobacterium tiangeerense]|uniref:Uncharacterized protein n=1 Tax=Flavobacterium tiangeerense TaxID=459471 RepID=A0ABY3FP04_9FLAO|nr:hypothetical protein [Flavobacterium tiangeerense]TWI03397.1 hypothetical protein IQ05_00342 [Flavobacterium tiangeerense]
MSKQIIEIESFNPYESRFPNRKLVTRETLILMKYLREEGYEVKVLPDNDQPIEILYKKGLADFFADPVFIALIGIPIGIITTIVSNKIQKLIDSGNKKEKINQDHLIIQIDNSTHNYLGEKFLNEKKHKIKKKCKELKDGFAKCFEIISPKSEFPTPIFLEHKPQIIGWCSLYADDKGLKAKGIITDKIIKKRIKQKRLNGMSVTGIAKITECSICKKSYVECNHVAGNDYGDKSCYNTIIETDYVETSIVKEPINSQCLVSMK